MIYELAQTVQYFLLKYNKPPRGSFYDEMLQENQKREQERLDKQKRKENLERQTLIEEVERRKEMFKSEAKRRGGETRRSMSESNYHASSSESSENSSPYYRSHCYPNKCLEHRNSEKLYFHKVGRQVQRGCCLGEFCMHKYLQFGYFIHRFRYNRRSLTERLCCIHRHRFGQWSTTICDRMDHKVFAIRSKMWKWRTLLLARNRAEMWW